MAERVLTDEDVAEVIYSRGGWQLRDLVRAAEAATLAKVAMGDPKSPTFPTVTEREARKRERLAYSLGFADRASADISYINARYPLPTCDKCGQELP